MIGTSTPPFSPASTGRMQMTLSRDSFAERSGALAERPQSSIADELGATRWWLERLTAWSCASQLRPRAAYLGALNELRDHLRRCYDLGGEQAAGTGLDAGLILAGERRQLDEDSDLGPRLEALLGELREEECDLAPTLERLRELLADFAQLDLEPTHTIEPTSRIEERIGD